MTPLASLSLDLDNQWSYMKTHGDPGWASYPTYLPVLVPRVLESLDALGLRITFFVVGQDAALPENHDALAMIAAAGHEVANHSFAHEPWLHRYTRQEIERDIGTAEEEIERATGQRPRGFRGPGFSFSPAVFDVLLSRGYQYDATTFPTFIGPLARAFYFRTAKLDKQERESRKKLFGTLGDGLRPLKPYRWQLDAGTLAEIPVTTMPLLRVPIHVSYLHYLAGYSRRLARLYFGTALRLCRLTGVEPSILLHPLDFLGSDDRTGLDFFPAMQRESEVKIGEVERYLANLDRQFEVLPVIDHVSRLDDVPLRSCRG